MHKHTFRAMSTTLQIGLSHPDKTALAKTEALFREAEQVFSRFRADSELSLLNARLDQEVAVSSFLFDLLKQSAHFYEETDGLFQPGVLSALEQAGYSRSIEHIRNRELAAAAAAHGPVHTLPYSLQDNKQTVILHRRIDLGGIAKGWTVDRAADVLVQSGFGFVNAGGDIRVFGPMPQALRVGIEHPLAKERVFDSISLISGAIATSSTGKRRWLRNGEVSHHLIDPRTGTPADSPVISATVTAPTAAEADVWAKTMLLLGETDGREWIARKHAQAVLMNCRGEIWRRDFN